MKLGFRDSVRWVSQGRPEGFQEHLDEAFSAMANFIRENHPGAELKFVGYDHGGPIWKVEDATD